MITHLIYIDAIYVELYADTIVLLDTEREELYPCGIGVLIEWLVLMAGGQEFRHALYLN